MTKLKTHGGAWRTDKYMREVRNGFQRQNTSLDMRGCIIEMFFEPGPGVDAQKIGFLQTVRSLVNNAPFYGPAEQQREGRALEDGTNLDVSTSSNGPVYGINQSGAANPQSLPSDVANLDDSKSTSTDFGSRNASTGKSKPAKLYDRPKKPWTQGSTMDYTFETTATCLDGPQKGLFYGSVDWGFSVDAEGSVQLKDMHVISLGAPSETLRQAAQQRADQPTVPVRLQSGLQNTAPLSINLPGENAPSVDPSQSIETQQTSLTQANNAIPQTDQTTDRQQNTLSLQTIQLQQSIQASNDLTQTLAGYIQDEEIITFQLKMSKTTDAERATTLQTLQNAHTSTTKQLETLKTSIQNLQTQAEQSPDNKDLQTKLQSAQQRRDCIQSTLDLITAKRDWLTSFDPQATKVDADQLDQARLGQTLTRDAMRTQERTEAQNLSNTALTERYLANQQQSTDVRSLPNSPLKRATQTQNALQTQTDNTVINETIKDDNPLPATFDDGFKAYQTAKTTQNQGTVAEQEWSKRTTQQTRENTIQLAQNEALYLSNTDLESTLMALQTDIKSLRNEPEQAQELQKTQAKAAGYYREAKRRRDNSLDNSEESYWNNVIKTYLNNM